MRVKTPDKYLNLVLEVSRRIVAHRTSVGITRRLLAERIGITEQALHRLETGKRSIPIWRLAQIADVIGADMVDLVADLKRPSPPAATITKHAATTIAIDAFNAIPDESKIVVANLIRTISETMRDAA